MGRLDLPNRYNVGADLLDRNLEAGRGNKIAIFSAAGDLTYLDLFKLSNGAAHALHDLGVKREERVLIAAYDGPGWVAAFLRAIRLGAVPVPVNPLLQRSEDYDHYIDDSLARVVIVDGNTEEKLRPAVDRAVHAPRLLRTDQIKHGAKTTPATTRRDDMAICFDSSASAENPEAIVELQHEIPSTCVTYTGQVLG